MRMVFALIGTALFAAMSLAAQAQTKPTDDHGVHHPDAAPSAPGPQQPAGGMGMMGGSMMGGGMMGGGDMGRMMSMMHGGMMMGGMPFGHIEGRLAFLKAELKITPGQEPQWTRFADVVRATAKSTMDRMQPMMMGA